MSCSSTHVVHALSLLLNGREPHVSITQPLPSMGAKPERAPARDLTCPDLLSFNCTVRDGDGNERGILAGPGYHGLSGPNRRSTLFSICSIYIAVRGSREVAIVSIDCPAVHFEQPVTNSPSFTHDASFLVLLPGPPQCASTADVGATGTSEACQA